MGCGALPLTNAAGDHPIPAVTGLRAGHDVRSPARDQGSCPTSARWREGGRASGMPYTRARRLHASLAPAAPQGARTAPDGRLSRTRRDRAASRIPTWSRPGACVLRVRCVAKHGAAAQAPCGSGSGRSRPPHARPSGMRSHCAAGGAWWTGPRPVPRSNAVRRPARRPAPRPSTSSHLAKGVSARSDATSARPEGLPPSASGRKPAAGDALANSHPSTAP